MAVKKITFWSFSRYGTYKQCPYKAKLQYLDKLPQPGSPAMDRGKTIHDLAEDYIRSKISAKIPPELKKFEALFKKLRADFKKHAEEMVVEDTWAFTREWDETVWNDWARCWLRVKLDVAFHENDSVLIVRDWKTGKFRIGSNADYCEQLELYALAALMLHEHIEEVRPSLAYLDHGITYPEPGSDDEERMTFRREDIPRLKKLWEKRVTPMLTDTVFKPTPNQWCGWCHYRKDNGGPCSY